MAKERVLQGTTPQIVTGGTVGLFRFIKEKTKKKNNTKTIYMSHKPWRINGVKVANRVCMYHVEDKSRKKTEWEGRT